jgi:hypothetical protein
VGDAERDRAPGADFMKPFGPKFTDKNLIRPDTSL